MILLEEYWEQVIRQVFSDGHIRARKIVLKVNKLRTIFVFLNEREEKWFKGQIEENLNRLFPGTDKFQMKKKEIVEFLYKQEFFCLKIRNINPKNPEFSFWVQTKPKINFGLKSIPHIPDSVFYFSEKEKF